MQIVKGQDYTFHFSTTGNDIAGTMGQIDALAAQGLVDEGFPISIKFLGVSSSGNTLGLGGPGVIDVAFTYNGQDTDSDSLGNAMQDSLNAATPFGRFSNLVVNFESVDEGNTTTGIFNADIVKPVKAILPSPAAVGIGALAILLLVVAVFAFSRGLGEGIA